jgi:hypothetical protein
VVLVTSERCPLPALSLAEVLATSDVPGGVVNVLSGRTAEIALPLAAHADVNAIDLTGTVAAPELAKELETAAADNLKRVLRPRQEDWTGDPGTTRLLAFWHTTPGGQPAAIGARRPGDPPDAGCPPTNGAAGTRHAFR